MNGKPADNDEHVEYIIDDLDIREHDHSTFQRVHSKQQNFIKNIQCMRS